jgi:hypothetical protein
VDSVGLPANQAPIIFADVVIDFNWTISAVQGVTAIAFWPTDPVVLASFDVEVVRFEACAFEALKFLAVIVKSATSLRKGDAADACYASEGPSLAFDVHDAAGAS